jgi:hypothetical protein
MTEWREFRPQSTLLQSNFDGYRLSLEPLAQYSLKFDEHLHVQKDFSLDNEFYTLNGLKAFKSINQLVMNPWNDDHELYFFDQTHSIQRICISSDDSLSHLQQPIRVHQLSNDALHGSMIFITKSIVLLADGRSKLSILKTDETKWKKLHEEDLDDCVTTPIRLLHAISHENGIHAIIGYINGDCQLLWLTFSLDLSGACQLVRKRILQGKNWPDFVAIELQGNAVYIAVEKVFKFTFDSLVEVNHEVD